MPIERDITKDFKDIVSYPLLTPTMSAEAGWPDKLIQLSNSRVIACELKRVYINQSGYYRLSELRQEQAAWLAKWQHNGGKCFVFVGVCEGLEVLGYQCITCNHWSDWLQVNKRQFQGVHLLTKTNVAAWLDGFVHA